MFYFTLGNIVKFFHYRPLLQQIVSETYIVHKCVHMVLLVGISCYEKHVRSIYLYVYVASSDH